MTDTTVRIPRKGPTLNELQDRIDALEALLKKGLSSSDDLQTALALLTDDSIHAEFEIRTKGVAFDKLNVIKIMKLINYQLSLWRKERDEMLSIN